MKCYGCQRSVKLKANFCGVCGAFLSRAEKLHAENIQSLFKVASITGATVLLGILFLFCALIIALTALAASVEFIALSVLALLFTAVTLTAAAVYGFVCFQQSFYPFGNTHSASTNNHSPALREPLYSVTEETTLIMPNPPIKIRTFQ